VTSEPTTDTTEPTTTQPTIDERILNAAIEAMELLSIHVGAKLGLYETLHAHGPSTPDELAAHAGIAPRYAREWLEQQAVAGFLAVDGVGDGEYRFSLPAEHVGALVEPTALDHLAPIASMVAGIANVLDEVVAAYRTGEGVPYARYGADFRQGQGAINRPMFTTALTGEWLPAAGLADTLHAGGRIADLGCGIGWSTIALAQAYPGADVWGIDADVASIEEARALARTQHVEPRFEAVDAGHLADHGPFDAILVLEALHDMARPVEVLAAARKALARSGAVIVADEAVADAFTAPGDDMERIMYGFSVLHCLPASMAEQPSAAIGTVIRERTVRELAHAAGFAAVEVLPVDGGFFRIYKLTV